MSNIFYSYLEGAEREEAITSAEIDLTLSKLRMMCETVDIQLEANIKDAEYKVLKESGTYEDLQYLIEKANAEATEKKQGIISKIWEVIKSIFNGIVTSLKSAFGKTDLPKTVDTDETDVEKHNALNKVWGHVQKVIQYLKDHKSVSIAALGAAITAIGSTIYVFTKKKSGKTIKTPIETVKGWVNNLTSKCSDVISGIGPNAGEGDDHGGNQILQKLGNALSSWKNSLISLVSNGAQAASSGVQKVADSINTKMTNLGSNNGEQQQDVNNKNKRRRRKRQIVQAQHRQDQSTQQQTTNESVEYEWVYEGEEGFEDGIDEEFITVEEGVMIGGVQITKDSIISDDDFEMVEESVTEEDEAEFEALAVELASL